VVKKLIKINLRQEFNEALVRGDIRNKGVARIDLRNLVWHQM
jgi:hypothetical protein